MSSRMSWNPHMESIGDAVVAIGVFDGVHLGHQALLSATIGEAHHRGALSVVLTFDRDPDQLLHPEAVMPQLLALPDRITALEATGVDVIIIVPFTDALAKTAAENFLDEVLLTSCVPLAIHVGEGFRFGADASGDLDTLYVWGVEHNVEIRPHELVDAGGAPVSSTRIRSMIARGDVAGARTLLGRPPSVRGTVRHGRGEGATLGYATANVAPDLYAASPADGVYAGRALLADDTVWPAAISVGVPPTFPEAQDCVEAHILGFTGDLYETGIVLEFLEYLRPQERFASARLLSDAIAGDIECTRSLVRAFESDPNASPVRPLPGRDEALAGVLSVAEVLDDGTPVVDDPLALEVAEQAAAAAPLASAHRGPSEGWVTVFGPARISSLLSDGGVTGAVIAGPLAAANIPFAWDPFPPELAQTARPDFNWMRRFSLLVAPEYADEARAVLKAYLG